MTRSEARELGLRWYVSSRPCPKGHVERSTSPKHYCKECARLHSQTVRRKVGHAARERAYRHKNPEVILLREAKKRAKARNLPFDLVREDIVVPKVCPVLGIPIVIGSGKLHDNSATVDRLIPERGYVRGNVCVISFRANAVKRNASLTELRAIVSWLEKL